MQNHLQTTWLLVQVLYSVEQPPHCDLLRLSLRLDDLFIELKNYVVSFDESSTCVLCLLVQVRVWRLAIARAYRLGGVVVVGVLVVCC